MTRPSFGRNTNAAHRTVHCSTISNGLYEFAGNIADDHVDGQTVSTDNVNGPLYVNKRF